MKTILVVDDEYSVVDALSALLSDEGYTVVTAANGDEALARIADAVPDLVLLDVMMPVVDGRAVLRRIRETPALQSLPVIGMSAAVESIRTEPWSAFLRKPFSLDQLIETVEKLIGKPA